MPEVRQILDSLYTTRHRLINGGRDKATYELSISNNSENADFGKQHLPVT
jgi:hypothetical protein